MTVRAAGSHNCRYRGWRGAALTAALVLPWLEGGCFLFPRAKPVPPTLVLTQPIILQPPAVAAQPAPPAPPPQPKVIVLAPESAPKLVPPPHRRRRAAAPTKPEAPPPVAVAQGPAPQLTSQLTAGESAGYRRTAAEWLDAANHDLMLTAHWRLNSEQLATRAQANEYIRQARTALDQGAVVRAQNLAHKALVLAEALLGG